MFNYNNLKNKLMGAFILITIVSILLGYFCKGLEFPISVLTIVAALIIGLGTGFNITNTIITILKNAENIAQKVSSYQEKVVQNLITNLENLSKGNLDSQFVVQEPDSDTMEIYKKFNLISNSLIKCENAIKNLILDAYMLSMASIEGKLQIRADAAKHEGEYRTIIEGMNDTLNAVIIPLKVAANYIDRISKGDIPEKITDNYEGDFNEIKNNINVLIDAQNCISDVANKIARGDINVIIKERSPNDEIMRSLARMTENLNTLLDDINILTNAAIDGKLDTRGNSEKFKGTYREIIKGINDTLDAVLQPLKVAADCIDRISKGDIPSKITDTYKGDFNKLIDNLNQCIDTVNMLISDVNMLSDASIEGLLDIRADIFKHQGRFSEIIQGFNETLNTLVGHIDNMPVPTIIIDKEFNIRYLNAAASNIVGLSKQQVLGSKCYEHFKTSDCRSTKCACGRAMKEKRPVTSESNARPRGLDLELSHSGVPIRDKQGNVLGALETMTDWTDIKYAAKLSKKIADYQTVELNKITQSLNKMAEGNLSFKIEVAPADSELEEVRENFLNISHSINKCVRTLQMLIEEDGGEALKRAANRDLTVRVKSNYEGMYEVMKNNINLLLENLDQGMAQVYASSDQVANASVKIGRGSQTMAGSASEQASTVEEVSSSVLELSSMTKQNALNAKEAETLAKTTLEITFKGVGNMNRLTDAINNIKVSSDKTAKIIKTIDEIAFQTNLLALNAAVEAARAGEAGRGFAVVADEVRNLAMRSADAAKNTEKMIEESIKNADNGVNINQEVLNNLKEIHNQANRVSIVMSEINTASEQQAAGIEQINSSLDQLGHVIQADVINSQEFANSAEELSNQAKEMEILVSSFEISKLIDKFEKALVDESRYGKAKTRSMQNTREYTENPHNAKIIKPEHLLPLDNFDELQTF